MLTQTDTLSSNQDRPVGGFVGFLAIGLITGLLALALIFVMITVVSGQAWGHWYFEGYTPQLYSEMATQL